MSLVPGSTLVQAMTCCLTALSHYLNQCWIIITKVLWHSCECIFTGNIQYIFQAHLQGTNESTHLGLGTWRKIYWQNDNNNLFICIMFHKMTGAKEMLFGPTAQPFISRLGASIANATSSMTPIAAAILSTSKPVVVPGVCHISIRFTDDVADLAFKWVDGWGWLPHLEHIGQSARHPLDPEEVVASGSGSEAGVCSWTWACCLSEL